LFLPALAVYLLFMGVQGRYFGRWLMPIIPLICVLAGYAGIRMADAVARGRRHMGVGLALLAGAVICAQGLVYSIHSGLVNSRADTRNITRAWLVAHVPLGTKVLIEPVVPEEWGLDVGHPLATSNGYRWQGFPVLRKNEVDGNFELNSGPSYTIENYEKLLSPALISFYEREGFCWVVTGSQQSGRAFVDPRAVPQAIAYYKALEKDGRLMYESSPYAKGSRSGFSFDWSFDYYPLAYERPGPLVKVYRLDGGRCAGQ
jgi:hypothetical protein